MHRAALIALFLLVSAWVLPARAEGPTAPDRPRVALVLAGGGARGAVHVGVLEELERQRIPIDLVVGTSMGAVVGGLYCAGRTPLQIEEELARADWDDLFSSRIPRSSLSFRRKLEEKQFVTRRDLGIRGGRLLAPRGLVADQKLRLLLRSLTRGPGGEEDFDRLPVPFRAVATDLESGKAKVLASGDLAEAMRASMSVPGVFSPVEWEGGLLVDGGVRRNLAVDVALSLGAGVIIAVDVPPARIAREDLDSLVGVSARVLDIYTRVNVEPQLSLLRPGDILITPDPGDAGAADFNRAAEVACAGSRAACAVSGDLARLALAPAEFARHLSSRPPREDAFARPLSFVRVEGPSFIFPEVLAGQVRASQGRSLDMVELREDLLALYGTGDFDLVDFSLDREPGAPGEGDRVGLTVRARENLVGPNYVGFGLKLEDDFEGETGWELAAGYTRTWINRLGGEWKTVFTIGRDRGVWTELWQPLTASQWVFLAPRLSYRSDLLDLFEQEDRVAVYGVRKGEAGIDLGFVLGTAGELRLGLTGSRASSRLKVGAPSNPEFTAVRGAYRLSLSLDGMDRASFPRHGAAAGLSLYLARPALGSDAEYEKASLAARQALPLGKFTLLLGIEAGTAGDTAVPFDDQFTLGGFQRLSGLREGRLRGPTMGLARLAILRRNGTLPSSLGDGTFVGVSVEAGNVWQARDQVSASDLRWAGSLFFAADLAAGPFFIGYGRAQGDEELFFLTLGRGF